MPYKWTRKNTIINHTGTVPATFTAGQLYTPVTPGYSVRQRLNLELSLIANGGSMGTDPQVSSEMICTIGIWAFSGSSPPAASPSPIANESDGTRWLLWEALTPQIVSNDPVDGEFYIKWTYNGETDQTRSKFSYPAGTDCSVWLAWEFLDPNAVVNGTIGGIVYQLGAWYSASFLDHYT